MPISQPFFLTVRPLTNNRGYECQFVNHHAYAKTPSNYTRAFSLIQNDLITLFEYIEPSKKNLTTHSFRIMELLLRTCTELEANFKAILRANGYTKKLEHNWNIEDFFKIETSHYLSQYQIRMPYWTGAGRIRQPFKDWSLGSTLGWYRAYNNVKHDRANNLDQANLGNLIDAVSGLSIILAAQYWIYDYTPNSDILTTDDGDEFESGIGGYLRVKFPTNIPNADKYDFDWGILEYHKNPFAKFDYNSL